MMVCRDTPTSSARAVCVFPAASRNLRTLFFTTQRDFMWLNLAHAGVEIK
jgi:hypothetical protein